MKPGMWAAKLGIWMMLALGAGGACADVVVGVDVSLTGPAASLGIPERDTVLLFPTEIAGQVVRYLVADDASDTSSAVKNVRKLVNEDRIDVLFGPSTSPTSLAVLEVVGHAETPMVAWAGSNSIVEPVEGNRRWAFKQPPPESIQGARIFDHLKSQGGKTVAYAVLNNAFGETFQAGVQKVAEARGVRMVALEKYNATDTTVTAQVLKILAASPDAVVIASSGTPGALPVIELRKRGYRGLIYINQGMANNEVLRVGGRDMEGVYMPVSPALVAEQLADSDPVKPVAMEYVRAFEGKYGANTRTLFGATAWDSLLILKKVLPDALKAGKPQTVQFRRGLRDAIERVNNLVCTEGVYSMSPTDHVGADARAQVLVKVVDGHWVLQN